MRRLNLIMDMHLARTVFAMGFATLVGCSTTTMKVEPNLDEKSVSISTQSLSTSESVVEQRPKDALDLALEEVDKKQLRIDVEREIRAELNLEYAKDFDELATYKAKLLRCYRLAVTRSLTGNEYCIDLLTEDK